MSPWSVKLQTLCQELYQKRICHGYMFLCNIYRFSSVVIFFVFLFVYYSLMYLIMFFELISDLK